MPWEEDQEFIEEQAKARRHRRPDIRNRLLWLGAGLLLGVLVTSLSNVRLFALAPSQQFFGIPRAIPAAPVASAVVQPEEARFTIPLAPREQWQWWRADSGTDFPEYTFLVLIPSQSPTQASYELSLTVRKRDDKAPVTGSLEALITAGTIEVKRKQDGAYTPLPSAIVTVQAVEGQVQFVAHGQATVRQLLGDKPPLVGVAAYIPERNVAFTRMIVLPIQYDDKEQGVPDITPTALFF